MEGVFGAKQSTTIVRHVNLGSSPGSSPRPGIVFKPMEKGKYESLAGDVDVIRRPTSFLIDRSVSLVFDMLLEYLANRVVNVEESCCFAFHSIHEKLVPERGANGMEIPLRMFEGTRPHSTDTMRPPETSRQVTLPGDDLPPRFRPE